MSKFTIQFKTVSTDAVGVLNELQFKQLLHNMHAVTEGGLFAYDQDVDQEVERLLEAVDP